MSVLRPAALIVLLVFHHQEFVARCQAQVLPAGLNTNTTLSALEKAEGPIDKKAEVSFGIWVEKGAEAEVVLSDEPSAPNTSNHQRQLNAETTKHGPWTVDADTDSRGIYLPDEFFVYKPDENNDDEQVAPVSSLEEPTASKADSINSRENLDIDYFKVVSVNKGVQESPESPDSRESDNDTISHHCIGSDESDGVFQWQCLGMNLLILPAALNPKPTRLRLKRTAIETLTRRSVENYRETLRDFSIETAQRLQTIEEGTFDGFTQLRVVYIFNAPKLQSFDLVLSGAHPNLKLIRMQQTGLTKWPDFSRLRQGEILAGLDFVNSKISNIGALPFNFRTESLNLEFNLITSIEEQTFNGSEIGALSLSGNRLLRYIHPNAFANLRNLVKLDLSQTSISSLPSVGLHQLQTLIIRDNYALKRIPSIYALPELQLAELTYAYHCCSFRYPATHDPSAYEDHRKLQEEINKISPPPSTTMRLASLCAHQKDLRQTAVNIEMASAAPEPTGKLAGKQYVPTTASTLVTASTTTEGSEFEGYFGEENKAVLSAPPIELPAAKTSAGEPLSSAAGDEAHSAQTQSQQQQQQPKASSQRQPLHASLVEAELKRKWPHMHHVECGELALKPRRKNITCTPVPDAFNPCEDIMGYTILRIAVWFVVGASVCGNLCVIVVLVSIFRRLSVPRFLQLNLAIGDLFMGVYLAMLAFADVTTVGSYFNYAIDWQHGYGCKIAGAASLFASQLSIFTLSVITFERYFAITYSIDLNMRLQLGWAARIMFAGWVYAFLSAMLPVLADINSYTKTSICVPMRTTFLVDRLFIGFLLLIDSSAFIAIFLCYLKMYLLIVSQKTKATAKERTIAKRMALLVFTDFACWAPIIFFGATAFLGEPLISVTNSKILIVFFYPLNSMANPFLYVISTRAYKRDLDYLTQRWQAWRKNLLRNNHDNYYSNNAYERAIQYNNNLQGNLNAVAAVTGVANHLHHNQLILDDNNNNNCDRLLVRAMTPTGGILPNVRVATGGAGSGCVKILQGLKLHEHHHQRVVCSKVHKSQYVIRHQIITSATSQHHYHSRNFNREQRRSGAGTKHNRSGGSKSLPRVSLEGPFERKRASCDIEQKLNSNPEQVRDEFKLKEDDSSASKKVNISVDSFEPVRDCDQQASNLEPEDPANHDQANVKIFLDENRKLCDKCRSGNSLSQSKSSNGKRKHQQRRMMCCDFEGSPSSCCNKCCSLSATLTSQKSHNSQKSGSCKECRECSISHEEKQKNMATIYILEPALTTSGGLLKCCDISANSSQPIDVLGNISYNEPISSSVSAPEGSNSMQQTNKDQGMPDSKAHKSCVCKVDLEPSLGGPNLTCRCDQLKIKTRKTRHKSRHSHKLCVDCEHKSLEKSGLFVAESENSTIGSAESSDIPKRQSSHCHTCSKHHHHHHQHHTHNSSSNSCPNPNKRLSRQNDKPNSQDLSTQTNEENAPCFVDEPSKPSSNTSQEERLHNSNPPTSQPKEPESILKTSSDRKNTSDLDSNSSNRKLANGVGLLKTTKPRSCQNTPDRKKRVSIISYHHSG